MTAMLKEGKLTKKAEADLRRMQKAEARERKGLKGKKGEFRAGFPWSIQHDSMESLTKTLSSQSFSLQPNLTMSIVSAESSTKKDFHVLVL